MTSKKTYKELENEKTRGRKRFLERIQETKDAEAEIKEFTYEQEEYPLNEENKNSI